MGAIYPGAAINHGNHNSVATPQQCCCPRRASWGRKVTWPATPTLQPWLNRTMWLLALLFTLKNDLAGKILGFANWRACKSSEFTTAGHTFFAVPENSLKIPESFTVRCFVSELQNHLHNFRTAPSICICLVSKSCSVNLKILNEIHKTKVNKHTNDKIH